MPNVSAQDVQVAIGCVHQDIVTGEYRVELGMGSVFNQRAISIAEDINLDNDEHLISKHAVVGLIRNILIDVKKESDKAKKDIVLSDEFEKQKQIHFSEVLGGAPNEYEIVFPLNLQVLGTIPNEIDLGNTKAELITFDDWKENYLQPGLSTDSSNFSAFYEENPNSPDRFKWSFWRVVFPARDAPYAMQEVREILTLLLAEINFLNYRWTISLPRHSSKRAPRDRWSYLQLPFVFLSFLDGEFQDYHAVDYDYRGGVADRTFMPKIESIDSLPGFYRRRRNLNEVDNSIVTSLIAFQDGITEPVPRRSFFDFWRAIENLGGGTGIANKDIVNRAEFALHFIRDFDSTLRPEIDKAISELDNSRNKLTHEWPKARISERDRGSAKLVLDGLLTLFLNYREEYNMDDFQFLLEYGVMTQTEGKIEQVVKALQRLDILE